MCLTSVYGIIPDLNLLSHYNLTEEQKLRQYGWTGKLVKQQSPHLSTAAILVLQMAAISFKNPIVSTNVKF